MSIEGIAGLKKCWRNMGHFRQILKKAKNFEALLELTNGQALGTYEFTGQETLAIITSHQHYLVK